MNENICNINEAIIGWSATSSLLIIILLLIKSKSMFERIICICFLSLVAIQAVIGFGGDSILKLLFHNKIIYVFEGIVNPPTADINTVNKYVFIQYLFQLMGDWITPIGLILFMICILINQFNNNNILFKSIILVSLGLFTTNLFILLLVNIFGIHGTLKL